MTEAEAIAAGLTVPQREVALDLSGEWTAAPRCQIGDTNPPQTRVCRSLVDKGVAEHDRLCNYRLTPLGLEVRKVLARTQSGSAEHD